ncbi:MAG: DUF4224 domain-containing protein [Pseudomonadota bacterium]|nr:DUF4224 domain-containing protein [Pseudomonadota bacterium]
MRLDNNQIFELTGFKRKSSQVAWFRDRLGVEVPFDRHGPILTAECYQKLLEKYLGILPNSNESRVNRPTVRMKENK